LGSDYDLTLWRAGRFMAFPFPQGARRESRRVESMAVHDGVLHIATMRSRFEWPFRGQAAGKGHPLDGAGGFDDLRAVFSDGARLLMGWRLRLIGGVGPPESIAFVTAWGRTFASGDPVNGVPGDGNLGVLQAGALEEASIDLTAELVNMITAQRAYQANAQTIKTQDQVLSTLVNLR
jgi:hypothetical protein